jgi:hypothetical protein
LSGWLLSLILIASTLSGATATEEAYNPIVLIYASTVPPAKIGETVLIPAKLFFPEPWKAAKVAFKSESDLVKIDEVIIGETDRYGYDFFVPATVKGEGRFNFRGNITVEARDGEVFANGQNVWTESTNHFGAFALDGEVFFASYHEAAAERMAIRNLKSNNLEYARLSDKKDDFERRLSRGQAISDVDEKRLEELRKDEIKRLMLISLERSPVVKPAPSTR